MAGKTDLTAIVTHTQFLASRAHLLPSKTTLFGYNLHLFVAKERQMGMFSLIGCVIITLLGFVQREPLLKQTSVWSL